MNYWRRRDRRKKAHLLLHDAVHGRHLREDIADPGLLEAQLFAEKAFREHLHDPDEKVYAAKANALVEAMHRVYPPAPHPRARGWVEIILVAFAVAWGFRTFFFQPYKIPTGSMQPTLYGIHGAPAPDGVPTNPVYWAVRFLLRGERLQTFTARSPGTLRQVGSDRNNFAFYQVGSDPRRYKIHATIPKFAHPGEHLAEGQPIARGILIAGDHLFVNRIRYNFTRPERGDITVFSVRGVPGMPNPDDFYIKRLAGLPGETLAISEKGWLVADGREIREPACFARTFRNRFVDYGRDPRMTVDEAKGLIHVLTPSTGNAIPRRVPIDHGPYLGESDMATPMNTIALSDRQYLFLGDNTTSSQDGRYFGGVDRQNLIGNASMVMLPLNRIRFLAWTH